MHPRRRRRLIRDYYAALPIPPGPSDMYRRRQSMDVYDKLGPLTKAAVDASPQDVELPALILRWRGDRRNEIMRNHSGSIDALERAMAAHAQRTQQPLSNPDVDRDLADYVTRSIKSRFGDKDFSVVRRR